MPIILPVYFPMLFSGNKFNGIYESSLFNRWPWFRRGSTAIGRVSKFVEKGRGMMYWSFIIMATIFLYLF